MTFRDIQIGQRFKFFEGGSLLTKTGARSYEASQWAQYGLLAPDPDQQVLPEHDCSHQLPRQAPAS